MSQFPLNLFLVVVLICALFATCLLGSTSLPVATVLQALVGIGDSRDLAVVWQIRLPRGLAAMFVGVALGMSGASLQGLLRNPLAEPGVLGVSATAALAATVAIYYGLVQFSMLVLPLAAIAGAMLATAFIAAAALRSVSVVTLILIGVGLSSFAGALMSLLMNFAPHPFTLADMVNWMLGSVANRSFRDLQLTLPFLLTGIVVLWRARGGLSVLTLGEEAARGSGLNLRRQRLLVVFGSGLATGAAVAMSGAIGFVGIVAPHLVRPWVGYDPSRTLLPSALMGGVLLVVADIVVRVLPTTGELKLGVVAALLGAPVFIWIAFNRSNRSA